MRFIFWAGYVSVGSDINECCLSYSHVFSAPLAYALSGLLRNTSIFGSVHAIGLYPHVTKAYCVSGILSKGAVY